MLQNDSLVYEYKKSVVYKDREAQIVQVYTPQKKALLMDMFVDAKTGKILTSSKPDPETDNYNYFADELDYQPIGKGVIFPLVYQVWVKGKLVTEGKFLNVVVK
ncbi:hypothetical protein [Pontibacter fetidus]|uniref:Uncharacterized protein n=1 Tax=Pontibacter fetidus TaxID=2700082 RepID=A0A6B2H7D2_9BACT|nr:hypothetical protein [Pontibacter fetidus]NDK55172.1 hypothetical protein [Pontibacter fetidus]